MAVFQNNLLAGAGAQSSGGATYTIDQSIRFNPADSAYMSRTPSGSSSSRKKWTFSGWFKRGNITPSSSSRFFNVHSDSNNFFISQFQSDDSFNVTAREGGSEVLKFEPATRFRDPSAWYHVVMAFDSTNSIGSERFRVYFNGVRNTTALETTPSADLELVVLENCLHQIGRDTYSGSTFLFDGYMADLVLLDGTSTDCSSFGEYSDEGIWRPKDVSGLTFGTNGFYIDGRDSADLGDDESGQGNDFTTSGLGAHDQMADSPSNNFCTPNPLDNYYCACTFSNGNMIVDTSNTPYSYFTTTQKIPTSGKWYAECRAYETTGHMLLGIAQEPAQNNQHYLGHYSTNYAYYNYNGKSITGTTQSTYGNTYTNGDIIGIAVDMDNNKLYFSKNGTFQNSGAPTSGSTGTGAISITGGVDYFYAGSDYGSGSASDFRWNFGQDPTFSDGVTAGGNSDSNGIGNFKYSVPSGYLALCTKNLGS